MPPRYRSRKEILELSAKSDPPVPRRFLGLVAVLIACALGAGVAWLVQAGMTYEFNIHPTAIQHVFFALGIVGMMAGAAAEGTGHGATFELHQLGLTVALIVNAVVYGTLMIVALILSRPRRYRKPR